MSHADGHVHLHHEYHHQCKYDDEEQHVHSDSLLLRGDDSGVATSQELPSCSGADCEEAAAALHRLPPEAVQWVITTTAGPGPGGGRRGGRDKGASDRNSRDRDPDGTIKQHYYPEGGWGWLVLFCALLVQVLTHGLHVAVGVLTPEMLRRFPRATYLQTGWFSRVSPWRVTETCKTYTLCAENLGANLGAGIGRNLSTGLGAGPARCFSRIDVTSM
jgi:hypothetical protein